MKTKLKITGCIQIADNNRSKKGLPQIESVRGLARELETHWPKRYSAKTMNITLHRANKTGIRKVPENLINDLMAVLYVNEDELLDKPEKLKGTVKVFSGKCNTLRTSFFLRLTFFSKVQQKV